MWIETTGRTVSLRVLIFILALGLFAASAILLQRFSVGDVLLIQGALAVVVLIWLLAVRRQG